MYGIYSKSTSYSVYLCSHAWYSIYSKSTSYSVYILSSTEFILNPLLTVYICSHVQYIF